MKRSSPLIIMVALTLATLSYGGKMAESSSNTLGRAPASILKSKSSNDTEEKPLDLRAAKSSQDPVVIAEFPLVEPPLEVEEIH